MNRQTDMVKSSGHQKEKEKKKFGVLPSINEWKSREDTKLRRNRGKTIPSSVTSRSTTSILNFIYEERNESKFLVQSQIIKLPKIKITITNKTIYTHTC